MYFLNSHFVKFCKTDIFESASDKEEDDDEDTEPLWTSDEQLVSTYGGHADSLCSWSGVRSDSALLFFGCLERAVLKKSLNFSNKLENKKY